MTGWLALVVILGLAAYRLTRVVTTDSITERARERLYRWAWVEDDEVEAYASAWLRWRGDEPFPHSQGVDENPRPPMPRRGGFRTYVSELFQCPWCLGVWISAAVVVFYAYVVADGFSVGWLLLLAAAVAGLQGFVASRSGA